MTDIYDSELREHISSWEKRGFCVIRGLLSPREAEELRRSVQGELDRTRAAAPPAGAGPVPYTEPDGKSAGVQFLTYVAELHDAMPCAPLVRRFTAARARIAAQLPGGAAQRHSRAHLCTSVICMPQGRSIDWHTDAEQGAPPLIAVLHLSRHGVDYEGGAFRVRDQVSGAEHEVTPSAGDAVLFPWDARHAVTEVTRGQRLVLSSGWLQEKQEQPALGETQTWNVQ
ncbi:2OG-Fe(II) oxygenase [Streptomyces geranii]|uniref:2OG-Fe(II) oxygenase n=1 Tax=Streptomyces geranii TaxID=2058923 RepID=UPI00130096DF|nr:2OG-Fe(II) oxygenase [Streptomyces geranii]